MKLTMNKIDMEKNFVPRIIELIAIIKKIDDGKEMTLYTKNGVLPITTISNEMITFFNRFFIADFIGTRKIEDNGILFSSALEVIAVLIPDVSLPCVEIWTKTGGHFIGSFPARLFLSEFSDSLQINDIWILET
ncbi:MAG: hypothetical protein IJ489_10200 [Clostridia bacterium]|nr:hypothetical protein [Clostridia bacterium]